VALLAPLGSAIRGAPYQTALISVHFSWSLYQEYIRPRYLFDAFPFNLCSPSLNIDEVNSGFFVGLHSSMLLFVVISLFMYLN
jgi:hypothetical protein